MKYFIVAVDTEGVSTAVRVDEQLASCIPPMSKPILATCRSNLDKADISLRSCNSAKRAVGEVVAASFLEA